MSSAIELTLWIGPAVPIRVSKTVIDALDSVKVTTKAVGSSGFELNFVADVDSPLQTLFLIGGGVIPPLVRVVIAIRVNGQTDVLMDGVMTNHHIGTDVQNGKTTLSVIGEDLTRAMDYFDTSGLPFPAKPLQPTQPPARRSLPQAPLPPRRPARTGMTVEHPKYGTGTVVRREGEGDDAKITVSFPGYGLKKLVEKYAGLKKT